MEDTINRDWLTKDEADAFIGENADFYLEKWKSHSDSTLKGWNWAAMLLGICWMVYRKMYIEALLYYLIIWLTSFGIHMTFLPLWVRVIFDSSLLWAILMGVFGNALYQKKALRILYKAKGLSDSDRLQFLSKKGGTNLTAGIVCFIITCIFIFL